MIIFLITEPKLNQPQKALIAQHSKSLQWVNTTLFTNTKLTRTCGRRKLETEELCTMGNILKVGLLGGQVRVYGGYDVLKGRQPGTGITWQNGEEGAAEAVAHGVGAQTDVHARVLLLGTGDEQLVEVGAIRA